MISNIVNAGIIVFFLTHEKGVFRLELKQLSISKAELKKILQIGVPAGIQGMVFSISNVFVLATINSFGSAAVAGSSAALNYEYYCYFVVSAFAQATVAFTSQNYGAGQIERCKTIFRQSMLPGLLGCAALNLLIVWQKEFFIRFFTTEPEIIRYAAIRMEYVLLFQFIASSYEISGAALRGIGYSMTPTVLTIFGTCLLRLVWIFTVVPLSKSYETLLAVYPISWVITGISVFTLILAPTAEGLVNTFLINAGVIDSGIYFLGDSKWWRLAYYIINIWKETGWQTVIFMATLAGINTELYEAAAMDGAGRWGKMRYITFPALQNTILTVLILNLAKVMNMFESAFVMQNDAVLGTANVLETYIYYQTFNSGAIPNYGYTTAVGLFKSLVGCVLVLFCNHLSKKVRDGRGIV